MGANSESGQGKATEPAVAMHPSQNLGSVIGYPNNPQLLPPPAANVGRSVDQATFFPEFETEPRFIGARTGHNSILVHCGTCGYVGGSAIRGVHGAAKVLFSIITLGVGLFIPYFYDTGHFCPQCGRQVAVAKIM